MVPKPHSNFLSVQCSKCGEKVVIFTYIQRILNARPAVNWSQKKLAAKPRLWEKFCQYSIRPDGITTLQIQDL